MQPTKGATTIVFTKFIETKVRTWFKMNNKKKDGNIGENDYREMADLFITEFNLKDPKASEVKRWLVNGWNILIEKGKEIMESGQPGGISNEVTPALIEVNQKMNNGSKITEDEYIVAYKQLVEVNKNLFEDTFRIMVGSFFDVFDSDDDGFIEPDDLVKGLACFGIQHTDHVKKMFAAIDIDNKSKIDKNTYVGHWVEFMLGEDRSAPIARILCSV